jgi:peptide deformylase
MTVRGLDLHGEEVKIEADGLLARCLSHEIDHLNGILFVDHLSPLKRSLIRNRIKKLTKAGEW